MAPSERRFGAAILLLAAVLGGCASERGGVDAFPLYRNVGDAKEGEVDVLWPLAHFEWRPGGEKSWTIPFHVHWREEGREEVWLAPVIPLFMRQTTPDEEHVALFPLFSYDRDPRGASTSLLLFLAAWRRSAADGAFDRLALFPVFDTERRGAGRDTIVLGGVHLSPTGPLFALLEHDTTGISVHRDGDRRASSWSVAQVFGRLVELLHWDDTGSHDDFRLLTLFANEDWSLVHWRIPHEGAPGARTHRRVVFPFWFDVGREDGRRTRLLWPLFGTTTRGGDTVERFWLFPLLRTIDDPDRDVRGFDLLWPLVGRRREGGVEHLWVRPLFHLTSSEKGYEWRALLGLLGYGRLGDRRRVRVLFVPFEW